MNIKFKMLTIVTAVLVVVITNSCSKEEKIEGYNCGRVFFTEVFPKNDELFSYAAYKIWLPEGAKKIRGIIVHQHGCGRDGLSLAYDVHWQALAKRWDFALIGTHFIANDSCVTWNNPKYGSDRSFLSALKTLGEVSGHKELTEVPWCLWGHSGGGRWVTSMLNLHPEKIIAVFNRSGGSPYTENGLRVPVVYNYGIRDMRPEWYFKSYSEGRKAGGIWTLAIDTTSGHDTKNSRLLAIRFFDECIANRLIVGKNESILLNKLEATDFWLGNPKTFQIVEGKSYIGNPTDMTWLISNKFALKWQEFVSTGTVIDITPPENVPVIEKIEQIQNAVTIHFNLVADIESGVKEVLLFRDGKVIKKYTGPNDAYNNKNFQYANFGDEPIPESLYGNVNQWIPPKLEFTDYKLEKGRTYSYQIQFKNWSDLESPKSKEAKVTIQ